MAEIRTGEFSRHRNNLIDEHRASMVVLWDCGPEKPKPPVRPIAPKGSAGDPEYDLAVIELHDAREQYEIDLKAYGAAKREHEIWWRKNGGAVECQMWSCDARDAIQHDTRAAVEGRQSRRRYYISSKTRGYAHLANNGLRPVSSLVAARTRTWRARLLTTRRWRLRGERILFLAKVQHDRSDGLC